MHDGAVGLGEVTGLEPGVGVHELVHADRQQAAVDQAEGARAERAGTDQAVVQALDGVADRAPGQAEEHTDTGADEGHDDRHQAAAVEEAEPVDQPRAVVPLPEHRGQQTDHDAAQHARVLVGGGVVLAGEDLVLGDRERGQHVLVDQEADQRGEGGGAVSLLREADRDTHREQQRQAIEDRSTGGVEHRCDLVPAEAVLAEDVVLAEAHQQTGGGEHGNGQLQAAADLLQALEEVLAELLGGAWRGRSRGGRRCLRRLTHGGGFLTAWRSVGGRHRGPNRELVYTTRGVDQFCSTGGQGKEPRKAPTPGSAMKSKPTRGTTIMIRARIGILAICATKSAAAPGAGRRLLRVTRASRTCRSGAPPARPDRRRIAFSAAIGQGNRSFPEMPKALGPAGPRAFAGGWPGGCAIQALVTSSTSLSSSRPGVFRSNLTMMNRKSA